MRALAAPYEAMATRLECTVGTVQARHRLRATLAQAGQGSGTL
jgi:hypothetical protein